MPSGREFDVLLFATPQDAQDAVPEVRASQVVELCSGLADSTLPEADARTPGQDDPGLAADL
jgi:hypothetical protein